MKSCSKCKTVKELSEFSKNKSNKSGYNYWCKDCIEKSRKKFLEIPKNKQKKNEKLRAYRLKNFERSLVDQYRSRDKKKNRICNLTEFWVKENITSKPCIYCGETNNVSCDRIDNTKGHTMDNVVPCCYDCNKTRNNIYSFTEMLRLGEVIKQIKKDRK